MITPRSTGMWRESHCEFVRGAIGNGMPALLRDGDHEDDPTVVHWRLAVQAWEVWCCLQFLDAFCVGVPPKVDRFLHDIASCNHLVSLFFSSIVFVASYVDPRKSAHQNHK